MLPPDGFNGNSGGEHGISMQQLQQQQQEGQEEGQEEGRAMGAVYPSGSSSVSAMGWERAALARLHIDAITAQLRNLPGAALPLSFDPGQTQVSLWLEGGSSAGHVLASTYYVHQPRLSHTDPQQHKPR
jgi:hypothetical protein